MPLPIFVGSEDCKSCHKREYDLWKGSHHDLAMDVASDETMLGDFNDATLEHHGVSPGSIDRTESSTFTPRGRAAKWAISS